MFIFARELMSNASIRPTKNKLLRLDAAVWSLDFSGPLGERFVHVTPLDLLSFARLIKKNMRKIRADRRIIGNAV